jgi:hypothetical protein
MPKFCVKIKEVHTQVIEVEAENEQDAQGVAEDVIATGVLQDGSDLPEETRYDYTLERDEWDVWSAE